MNTTPTIGLYRHFKGEYYYIQNIVKDCTDGLLYCIYFNVCKPHLGTFVRAFNDWDATETDKGLISERPDNITGQKHRFEKVRDLNFQLGSISTEQLLEELFKRDDCSLKALDLEMFESKVDCKDFVVGQQFENYVATLNSFDTLAQAKRYLATHKVNSDVHLYKRTFIKIK